MVNLLNLAIVGVVAITGSILWYESRNHSKRFKLWGKISRDTYPPTQMGELNPKRIRNQYFLQCGRTRYCPEVRKQINEVINKNSVEYKQIEELEKWSIVEYLKGFGFFKYTEKKDIWRS